jgi:hypothetical protein
MLTPNRLKIRGPEKAAAVPSVLKLTFFASQVLQALDLRPHEDVQLGGEQVSARR